ncbi:MAG: NUDIX hydrolase N-terminal domain-containing protein [Halanaerobiales bacterium]
MTEDNKWLKYAKKLQSIAQAGLTYSQDEYHRERFEQIKEISLDILKNYTEIDRKKIRNIFAEGEGYPTPKVDVRAAVFKKGKILLVKEKQDKRWSLPGGWAEVDLSLKENIIKETEEEAGVKVRPLRIIAIQDRRKHNEPPSAYGIYKIFVECEYIEGSFEKNVETLNAAFFERENLPELSEPRNSVEQIDMCFTVKDKEVHEPYFD